ncbi:Pentatricopeptide repeat-containing protein At1g05600 [Linum grandiflorum]
MSVRWPRVLTPTYLSQIIRNQKNPLKALQLFEDSKTRFPNYRHNGPVYATMIDLLGKSGKFKEMKEVIEKMRDDSCECKDMVFANAINTYAGAGMIDEAVRLFKEIPKFNCVNWTESFNTLLKIMVKESRLESAHRLFVDYSCGWEVKSRVCSLNLLMEALCQQGKSDLASHVFQEMYYQGCYPDRESYRILMSGLCKDGRLSEAIHLLYSMFWRISQKGSGEDVVIYRTLLDALCDDGQIEEAFMILGKILKKGLKAPKARRPQFDLTGCSRVEDIEAAKKLTYEALIRGSVPSSASYTVMAHDFYKEGNLAQADRVLDVMVDRGFRPSVRSYEAKMVALCNEGRIQDALDVIDIEMVRANCMPTVRVYNSLLKGLCETGNSVMGVKYLDKMAKQVGCIADCESYTTLVHGLCKEGRFVEASGVLERMLRRRYRPSVDIFNTVVHGLCRLGRRYDAVALLEEMIDQGEVPDVSLWSSLVASAFYNMADIDVCSRTLLQISSRKEACSLS